MARPTVSVIMPAYNGADHIGEAVQSVLDQTYHDFELIVVDDASRDATPAVLAQFADPRLIVIRQPQNRGVCEARKTALDRARGEIIAFLDQDDLFHPEKLAAHVVFHAANPPVGFTYNGYFNLHHGSTAVRDIAPTPETMTLADLVLGFPLPPSVWVVKRAWALREELWDERTYFRGREIVFCGRLFMAGCSFARVDGRLNYRRYHAGRVFDNLVAKCEAELTCQRIVFADPRCPQDVLALRDTAFANIYLLWAYVALRQRETAVGQTFLRTAVGLKPGLLAGEPCELTRFLLAYSLDDEQESHAAVLRSVFDQFPPQLASAAHQCEWAVAQGYLLKGARALLWDRVQDGRTHLAQAATLNAQLDGPALATITAHILAYEAAFGLDATQTAVGRLCEGLDAAVGRGSTRALRGQYALNSAFQNYRSGAYRKVPRDVMQAVLTNPRYLTNRGALAILLRSTLGLLGSSA